MIDRRYTIQAFYTGGKDSDVIEGLTAVEASRVLDRIESEKPVLVRVLAELIPDEAQSLRFKPYSFGFTPTKQKPGAQAPGTPLTRRKQCQHSLTQTPN